MTTKIIEPRPKRLQTCTACKLGHCKRCTGIAEENTPWETRCKCAEQGHDAGVGESG